MSSPPGMMVISAPGRNGSHRLRRAKILETPHIPLSQVSDVDQKVASELVKAMGGLPLALDQVGAYIEETRCGLSSYLNLYEKQRDALLKRRGRWSHEHPEAVATTWFLNFEQVEHLNPRAAELLRFFAFLAPDAIPEELIKEGAGKLSPKLRSLATNGVLLHEAIGMLLRYSLVQRHTDTQVIRIHRLVQAVLKASLTNEKRRRWADYTVRAVSQAFPGVEVDTWPQCERLLPHALACAVLIEEHDFAFPEAPYLLNQAGYYCYEHAHYEQAEPLLKRALAMREKMLGPEHPSTKTIRENYAGLLR